MQPAGEPDAWTIYRFNLLQSKYHANLFFGENPCFLGFFASIDREGFLFIRIFGEGTDEKPLYFPGNSRFGLGFIFLELYCKK